MRPIADRLTPEQRQEAAAALAELAQKPAELVFRAGPLAPVGGALTTTGAVASASSTCMWPKCPGTFHSTR
jgi:hypothetical protein